MPSRHKKKMRALSEDTICNRPDFLVYPDGGQWTDGHFEAIKIRCREVPSFSEGQDLKRLEGGLCWQRIGNPEGSQIRFGLPFGDWRHRPMVIQARGASLGMLIDMMRVFEAQGHSICRTSGFRLTAHGIYDTRGEVWLVKKTRSTSSSAGLFYTARLPVVLLDSAIQLSQYQQQ
eukprot:10137-Heterococcus_DN1.PRE.4